MDEKDLHENETYDAGDDTCRSFLEFFKKAVNDVDDRKRALFVGDVLEVLLDSAVNQDDWETFGTVLKAHFRLCMTGRICPMCDYLVHAYTINFRSCGSLYHLGFGDDSHLD